MIYNKIFFLAFITISFKSCNSVDGTLEKEKTNNRSISDSLKIYFKNNTTKEIDSLSARYIHQSFSQSGIDLSEMLAGISSKDSNSYDYYRKFAYALIVKKRPSDALKIIRLAKSFAKDQSKFYFDQALAWSEMEPSKARDSTHKYLDWAIEADPRNPYYYASSAAFLGADDKKEKALDRIETAVNLSLSDSIATIQDTSFINIRGALRIATKDYTNGLKDLEQLSSDNLSNSEFYFWRAIGFLSMKDFTQVLEDAERSIKLNPDLVAAYVARSSALYKLDRKQEAFNDLKFAASKGDTMAVKLLDKRFPGWRDKPN